ncbi:uncharacterized protein LOC120777720 [Bactrocera tryoni]|uniref:uncharacterized protein LOC120777720 n=1 Tax=Bactrocera tryoni TaxID=59916 RepID=UPI001A99A0E1|nr:uncharacterized protein LOC120777720 [Bactrocera tryoni]
MFAVEDEDDINNVDDGGNAAAISKPPVAATRSTLTAHYAAGAKPPVAARTTPAACIEQRLPAFKAHSDNTANVQVVLLQNQVDTLQWQLKQVETSNEMYRAVIEEIARFLDRYQTQKQQQRQLQQQQQISRSKSLYQVYDGNSAGEGHEQSASGVAVFGDKSISTSSACLRTRSTSNLIVDLKQSAIHNGNATKSGGANMKHSSLATAAADKRSYDAINTTNNNAYTTFKDFTWRRSPKKYAESKAQAAADDLEEKLNQEAFRLSRTIHNLLNTSTRQPDLTQHRNAASACNNALHAKVAKPTTIPTNIPTTLITPAQNNASNKMNATAAADKHNSRNVPAAATNSLANATADMLFLRANNIRDSRLSLRSSTDSSVHSTTSNSSAVSTSSSSAASTSSSKVETDEDVTLHHPFHPIALSSFKQHQHPLSSATEDESGFSSISSFQDIGLPLCSTMISNGTSTPNRLSLASVKLDSTSLGNGNGATVAGLCDVEPREYACDSRNSTLKANHPGNVLGVPLQATHDMQHRWDTTSKTSYRNANKYQRFSTLSNEEASAVLWV